MFLKMYVKMNIFIKFVFKKKIKNKYDKNKNFHLFLIMKNNIMGCTG